ncbi:hypothetical protein GGX14DRAFT_453903 [Mycena pura]|uniref:Uncharacterized protein n=1 Tax=Mycena pura TaxID=153505 RepID=A0AAD6VFU9_9AGAR|nr:hypothetical protein GGX14DRAFT_453903 [Mycena pura]
MYLTLELKTSIAQQASLATLASFCATSRAMHAQASPTLYSHIDLDDTRRTSLLLWSLASGKHRPAALNAHPAALVRELKLWFCPSLAAEPEVEKKRAKAYQTLIQVALNNTAQYAVNGESRLRVFHWTSNYAVDRIFPLLRLRPRFQRLEDLRIAPYEMSIRQRTGFDFLQVPGLKSLGYEESTESYEICPREVVELFAASLRLVPTASPTLTVLDIDITWAMHSRLAPLEEAVNSLRFPSLRFARIQVFLRSSSSHPNFCPFLEAHPSLLEVAVTLGNIKQPLRDDALPLLQTFTGHASDFLQVYNGKRPIRDLTVSLFVFRTALRVRGALEPSRLGGAIVAALKKLPQLRRLAMVNRPVHYHRDSDDDDEMYKQGLDLRTLTALARACPQLTDLEIHLDSSGDFKALAAFSELRYLKAHVWMSVPDHRGLMAKLHHAGFFDGADDGDASLDEDKFAPAEGIRRDINLLLPALPKLRAVEVTVIGERESDLDSMDSWNDDTEEKIVYEEVHAFHIRREGKKVEAVEILTDGGRM